MTWYSLGDQTNIRIRANSSELYDTVSTHLYSLRTFIQVTYTRHDAAAAAQSTHTTSPFSHSRDGYTT